MSITAESALQALGLVEEPNFHRSVVDVGIVRELTMDDDAAHVALDLPVPGKAYREALEATVTSALKAAGARVVEIDARLNVPSRTASEEDLCPLVKNIVLIMSGKGGVGKSTVATNLAVALRRLGSDVGLLDADMYGPSIPTMLGVSGQPVAQAGQGFAPLERFGVKLMSIGFLLEDDRSAVVWRGPMLQNALIQFLRDIAWNRLDYLLIDMPPGTGDIALTISQKVASTGAIIVTTPQEVALQDVYKSVSMAKKVGIPLLGVVENESYFLCDGCSKRHNIFGSGGGQKVADFAEAPLLGQIPVEMVVREWGDAGTPVVEALPKSSVAGEFMRVAERLAVAVADHNLARTSRLEIDRGGGVQKRLPILR